jgi:hypothetical protein
MRLRAATAALVAAVALVGCVTTNVDADGVAQAELRSRLDTGLALYGDGEYAVAAPHFARAAQIAQQCGERDLEARARAAECAAWLRAREVDHFAACSERLGVVQRRLRRSDPGRNTLVALGAVAGRRPLPDLRVPDNVRPLLQDVAREFR